MIMIMSMMLVSIVLTMMTSILVRLHNEGAGGAWCPREPVSREKDQQWIQVGPHLITAIIKLDMMINSFELFHLLHHCRCHHDNDNDYH